MTQIQADSNGGYVLDLSGVDFASIQAGGDPVSVDMDLDGAGLLVIVPEDVRVDVDAEVDFLGSLQLFGQEEPGFGAEATRTVDDPQLDLNLSVDLGEIAVTRAS